MWHTQMEVCKNETAYDSSVILNERDCSRAAVISREEDDEEVWTIFLFLTLVNKRISELSDN